VPPTDDLRLEGDDGVDLEGLPGLRGRPQRAPELPFEKQGVERSCFGRPRPHRVVDVREHREGVALADQYRHLQQVRPDDLVRVPVRVQLVRLLEAVPVGKGVQGAQDSVERTRCQDPGGRLPVPVRLTEFQAGQDAKVGELPPVPLDRLQVAGGVERRRSHLPVGITQDGHRMVRRQLDEFLGVDREYRVIDVLGERDGRQPEIDRPQARSLHRPVLRIP
jgi:hypothetical protein